jgi:excisionase family DNA binding protein
MVGEVAGSPIGDPSMEPRPNSPITLRPWTQPDPPPLAMTTRDAAKALSVSESHVRNLIRAGTLGSVTIGTSRRVTQGQLAAYLAGLEAADAARPTGP